MGRGRPSFPQGSSCPVVLRWLTRETSLSLTGLSPSLADLSSVLQLAMPLLTPWETCGSPGQLLLPPVCNDRNLDTAWVWAPPLSLATTQGIFSFPAGTKMFQFPAFPPSILCVQMAVPHLRVGGFPIRVPPVLRLHTAYRGFSQCTAPFFGS